MPNRRKGKWLPFDALEGYREGLKKIEEEMEIEETPLLSDDQIIEINNLIIVAFKEKIKVQVKAIIGGKKIIKIGYIKKINFLYKIVILEEEKLKIEWIIDIILLE